MTEEVGPSCQDPLGSSFPYVHLKNALNQRQQKVASVEAVIIWPDPGLSAAQFISLKPIFLFHNGRRGSTKHTQQDED